MAASSKNGSGLAPFPDELEAEAVFMLREAFAQFRNPVILFSGGKDSLVLTHLAGKAFWPDRFPFSLLHIDTGHNFKETILFRDEWVKSIGAELHVRLVQDSIDSGRVKEDESSGNGRNALQSVTLLDAIRELKIDAAIGGGRRDEERARAKERFFSHRGITGKWEPNLQRPECWNLFNGRIKPGEHFRIFPLSNWTELDVWQYISKEKIQVPSLYFSHERKVFSRNNMLIAISPFIKLSENEKAEIKKIRFRTVGDMTCTGAMMSSASTVDEIVSEISVSVYGERGSRIDDLVRDSAMEERKKEGYF